MSMTKKDYELISATINDYRGRWMTRDDEQLIENIAIRLSTAFKAQDSKFKADAFIKQCFEKELV